MAGRGPAPKPADKRRRRNASVDATSLSSDGALRGSPLPRSGWVMRLDGEPMDLPWPEATKTWWLNWRRSPQAKAFTASDWDVLLETAVLHARFWSGDHSVASELRLRVAKFGATVEDRARLKMEIEHQDDAPASTETLSDVPDLTDYRRRYAAGSSE